MISYKRIKVCNTNKEGVKCMACKYYCFKGKFDYQPYVCNDCHDFSMTVMDLTDFLILKIKDADYRIYICNIDKKEAMII